MNPDSIRPSLSFAPKYQSSVDNWHPHRPFAYDLMTAANPEIFVELGVHRGDSYFTFCQARKEQNLQALCYAVDTWEGDPQAGKYGEEIFDAVEAVNAENYAPFSYLLRMKFSEALKQFSDNSIGLLHIDGYHTHEAVTEDFQSWRPKMKDRGIILLHDVAVREPGFGVWKLWESLKDQYPSFSFKHGYGLGVIQVSAEPSSCVRVGNVALEPEQADAIENYYEAIHARTLLKEEKIRQGNKLEAKRQELQDACDYNEKLADENRLLSSTVNSLKEAIRESAENPPPRRDEPEETKLREASPRECRVHWETPKLPFATVKGRARLQGTLHLPPNRRLKGLFVRLGSRTLACSPDFRHQASAPPGAPKPIPFRCEFKIGTGFKLCRLFVVYEDGSSHQVGARLLLSRKSPNAYVPPPDGLLFAARANDPYRRWLAFNQSSPSYRRAWMKADSIAETKPLYSFVMPVYDPNLTFLKEAVFSVLDQTYENWELCLVDDAGTDPKVTAFLDDVQKTDPRIKSLRRTENGGIAKATNDAISLATGEFLVFIDHDDLVEPTALSEINDYLQKHPKTDFLYTDDDKVDESGRRHSPQFKPDWSPELLLSYCYVGHMKVARAETSAKIGHVREGFDGSQDYDYALRLSEVSGEIGHLPKTLYHWRTSPGSTATSGGAKPKAFQSGLRALSDACRRRNLQGEVRQPLWAQKENLGIFEIRFEDRGPEVTILIPSRNNAKLLSQCLKSIERTTYKNYNIIILDNESDDPKTVELLQNCSHEILKVESPGGTFNFSSIVNAGVNHAQTPYVLLLNDDTEVINPRWLSQMVGLLGIDGVGAVGAKLLFGDETIQHAGIIHGACGEFAGPAFRGMSGKERGYLNYLSSPRNYSAVTAACLLTTKELYCELGGFDEERFAVAYNDVDFCYRIIESGKRCVYCPDAELFHHEGSSRGHVDNPRELVAFTDKHARFEERYYNPNLSLENGLFKIAPRVTPPPDSPKPKLLAVTHNLNMEGAPWSMFEMIGGLQRKGAINATIVSPCRGPLEKEYEKIGVLVRTLPFPPVDADAGDYNAFLTAWAQNARLAEFDLLYANTLDTFFAVDAANNLNVESIWNIRESFHADQLFKQLPPALAQRAFDCFNYPYRVVFVAEATKELYQPLHANGNFVVIKNALDAARTSREKNAEEDGPPELPIDEKVLLCVGTICKRKGQHDLIEAFEALPEELTRSTTIILLGEPHGKYGKALVERVKNNPMLRKKVIMPGVRADPNPWYRAAYAYVCASYAESYPRTILEAMAHDLPIVTTPVFGISEQVMDGVNALCYQPGDVAALTDSLESILSDQAFRDSLAAKSSAVLASKGSFENMLERYESIMLEAASIR